jgi:hypothetical protein
VIEGYFGQTWVTPVTVCSFSFVCFCPLHMHKRFRLSEICRKRPTDEKGRFNINIETIGKRPLPTSEHPMRVSPPSSMLKANTDTFHMLACVTSIISI